MDIKINVAISFPLIKMKIFINIIGCFWVLANYISCFWFLIKIMEWDRWKVLFWSMKMTDINFYVRFMTRHVIFFMFCAWKLSFFLIFFILWEMFEINLKRLVLYAGFSFLVNFIPSKELFIDNYFRRNHLSFFI